MTQTKHENKQTIEKKDTYFCEESIIDRLFLVLSKKQRKILEKARERYRDLSEEKQQKARGHERYKNFSWHEKQRLIEYGKKYYKTWKNKTSWQIKTEWCFW